MPGFYQRERCQRPIVGVVDHASMVDGRQTESGDVVLGLKASGLHTNGYSLARRILFDQAKLRPSSRLPGCGETVGDALMKVHRSYFKAVHPLLKRYNLPRRPRRLKRWPISREVVFRITYPEPSLGLDARIELNRWPIPPLFQYLAKAGKVSERDVSRLQHGIGLAAVHPIAKSCVQSLKRRGHQAWLSGRLSKAKVNWFERFPRVNGSIPRGYPW